VRVPWRLLTVAIGAESAPALRGGVSVLVPVLDEMEHIEATAAGLRAQRFDGPLEFLLIDGGSSDGTRAVLERLAADDGRFRVLENLARHIPSALNLGLHEARGEFVARMDAHTRYPPEYLARGVARLERGDAEWVSGPAWPEGRGRWSRRVAIALNTWLGVGSAAFRRATTEIAVDAGFTGVLRRSTLVELGGWDEASVVNEDAELAARVRAAGGRILCIPEMAARYVPRNNLRSLARQYWRYGQYRARTSRLHPESMRRSHLLPPAIVTTAGLAVLAGPLRRPARLGVVAYAAAVVAVSAQAARRAGVRDAAALPAVFVTMHAAWGAGFLVGCVRFKPPWQAVARLAGVPVSGA
jgi:cellulose synthase/poly-beta-1,6-N-acetylglucosamine synthase-like glycosyltransferase